MQPSKRTVLLALAGAIVLLAAACNGEEPTDVGVEDEPEEAADPDAADPDATELDGPITLYDAQWESLWVANSVIEFIIEEGYQQDVDIAEVSVPIMQQSIVEGEVHVAAEMWCMNFQEWCDTNAEAGDVAFAGTIFDEAEQGWYVPRYVVEGDEERGIEASAPGLQAVEDLPEYADVFEDPNEPGRGSIITGIAGWESTELAEAKVHAYGLDEAYNTQQVGSAAALDGAIAGDYERGDPVVFYYWAPSWIHAEFDLVLLDEPEWTEECQAALEEAVETDATQATEEAACAFAGGEVQQGVWPGLEEAAPEVAAFLERMHMGDEPMNEALAYMELEDADPDDAALWYFEEYADDWRGWIEDDEAVERVEEALRDRGADV